MLKQLTNVTVWVHDQDEALAFYTEKLGMELRDDVTVAEFGASAGSPSGSPASPKSASP
jgi:catechol 2,3-dioxygenase-like lactoylglutathione lyase family enzyme